MVFGAGNAALHFYTGSSLIGSLTAGTGTNTISFNGSGNGTFSNPIANFHTITKQDDGTWTLSGVVSGPTVLNVTQGTLILSAANTYSGATTINSGTLIVDGSIANSATTVNNGGTLAGTGTVGNVTVANGGTFAAGSGVPGTSMTVAGNLAFQSGALYVIQLNPTSTTFANVTGTASLAGTVNANFRIGQLSDEAIRHPAISRHRRHVSALTTTNLPAGFAASLGYTGNDVLLNLTATLGALSAGGLNVNQQNVANALNNFFNSGGMLPPNFLDIFGLTGSALGHPQQ